ncbi:hypothetical protein NFJ02_09g139860 [Pycnococcus provasolii]
MLCHWRIDGDDSDHEDDDGRWRHGRQWRGGAADAAAQAAAYGEYVDKSTGGDADDVCRGLPEVEDGGGRSGSTGGSAVSGHRGP